MMPNIARVSRRGILQNINSPFLASLTRLYPNIQIREKSNFSVYDSFRKGLPDMVDKNERPDVSTCQGGSYTIATDPPKVWVPLEFDDSISNARQFVEDFKEQLDNVSSIEATGLTSIDKRSSEQDVIKLFNLFVMYPVEIALLQIELPEHYKLNTRCEVHPDKGRAVLVDIILEAYRTSNPQAFKVLAIMEMKNFGVITDEMGHIMAAKVASVQEAQEVKPTSKVRFEEDSMLLLRQCAAYASVFNTRHVALCDWSVAIYLDFVQLNEALQVRRNEGGFAGEFVLMYAQTDPSTFHYALLAFFKGAIDEWLLNLGMAESGS